MMAATAAAFVVGAWSIGFLPTLPDIAWALLAVIAIYPAWQRPWLRPPVAAALGFAYAAVIAQAVEQPKLSTAATGDADVRITGEIVSLPERSARRSRFRFRVDEARVAGHPVDVPARIRLSWYGDDRPQLAPGQRWRLTARLQRPRGSLNPGGFDYERWLLRAGIGATGYVRVEPAPERLAKTFAPLAKARAALRERISTVTARLEHNGIVLALTVGDRDRIAASTWQALVATGTNHLVAISGLHIGLIAAAGFAVGRPVWRGLAPLRDRVARRSVQAATALAFAGLYAALSGFALPTQRAWVMLAVGLAAMGLRRPARPTEAIAAAAAAVVLIDPLAPLGAAFWLSFAAVATIILIAAGRLGHPRRLAAWVRVQGAVGMALVPLLVVGFGHASLIAPAVNLVVVPWVSLAVVPPALVGASLAPWWPAAAELVLAGADMAFAPVATLIEHAADFEPGRWHRASPPSVVVALALLGCLLLLSPRGMPGRVAGVVMLLPLAGWQPPRPGEGDVWIDLLDVGQGMAAIVRTHTHALVYDTGPTFSRRFDAGEAMVVPALRQMGVRTLDRIVVSHGHDDHAGGLDSVRRAYPEARVWSGEPHALDVDAQLCARGRAWRWDGVHFRLLHPSPDDGFVGNNASCVLRVEGEGGGLLLPGDIEAAAERVLRQSGQRLSAQVIVVPHHGSESSSTPRFVERVDPRWVLYPVGFGNRWDFPDSAVVERWRPAGWARTDCGGALHLRIDAADGPQVPIAFRPTHRRFWHAGCVEASDSGTMRAVSRPAAAAHTGE
jgi:competence protein ComEC